MSRLSKIITNVRRKLGDTAAQRWSDNDLCAYFNEAQEDVCKETGILRDKIVFYLVRDYHTYTLPENTLQVRRVEYKETRLPMKNITYMEQRRSATQLFRDFNYVGAYTEPVGNWLNQTTENDIICVVYDKLNRRNIRFWPKPIGDNFADSSALNKFYSPEGSTASKEYPVLPDLLNKTAVLVYRSRTPAELPNLNNLSYELEFDFICDKAIQYKMIALAFEDDIKESNRNIAYANLTRYYQQLDLIRGYAADDSTSFENLDTLYNGMG